MVKPRFVSATLKPHLVDATLQKIATGFIGPLPEDGGSRYILVTDYYDYVISRFPETYPARDMSVTCPSCEGVGGAVPTFQQIRLDKQRLGALKHKR